MFSVGSAISGAIGSALGGGGKAGVSEISVGDINAPNISGVVPLQRAGILTGERIAADTADSQLAALQEALEHSRSYLVPGAEAGYRALDSLQDILGIARPRMGSVASQKLIADTATARDLAEKHRIAQETVEQLRAEGADRDTASVEAKQRYQVALNEQRNAESNALSFRKDLPRGATQLIEDYETGAMQRQLGDVTAPDSKAIAADFLASPGVQAELQLGTQAIDRAASARGTLGSGTRLAALTEYAQTLASTRFNDRVNQLMALSGLGQQAAAGASQLAYNTGANRATVLGERGTNLGNAAVAMGNMQGQNLLNQAALDLSVAQANQTKNLGVAQANQNMQYLSGGLNSGGGIMGGITSTLGSAIGSPIGSTLRGGLQGVGGSVGNSLSNVLGRFF